MALPMTELTKASQGFAWTPVAQTSFNKLKKAFCEAPLLVQFRPEEPIFIKPNASEFAISGILSQKDLEGHKHPVAFYSQKLTPAERNYGTPD